MITIKIRIISFSALNKNSYFIIYENIEINIKLFRKNFRNFVLK